MKYFICISLFFILCQHSFSQSGVWTWFTGDSAGHNLSPSEPPTAYAYPFWTDTAGNFWLYTNTNLWKYTPANNLWTLMHISPDTSNIIYAAKGVFDTLNCPGFHYNGAFTWVTPDNDLWLFGAGIGGQDDPGILWRYSISLNQWAWMGTFNNQNYGIKGVPDTANSPGGRGENNCAWVDNLGNLWLFSGYNISNDMWKYDVTSGIWTWMSGSSNQFDPGNYGTLGVPSINNYPSARWSNFYWKDDTGNFCVGLGYDYSATDIWKFNPITLEWTWMSGSPNTSVCNRQGNFCDTSYSNQAGSRFEDRAMWKINDELIINYAGQSCSFNLHNDVWAYLPSTGQWIKLDDYANAGHYGTKGVTSPLDYPRYRQGSASFKDRDNNCWVFGGSPSGGIVLNDLWKYEIDWNCLPAGIIQSIQVKGTKEIENIQISPNPTTSQFEITSSANIDEVKITNLCGQVIQQTKLPPARGINHLTLQIENAGIYFVTIISGEETSTRKVVVVR